MLRTLSSKKIVLLGSVFAMLIANSIASREGLQAMSDLALGSLLVTVSELVVSELVVSKPPLIPGLWGQGLEVLKSSSLSVACGQGLRSLSQGLRVSKHITPSKQSSNPSLLKTFAA
eukprot:Gb_33648 [translate_table: standard]